MQEQRDILLPLQRPLLNIPPELESRSIEITTDWLLTLCRMEIVTYDDLMLLAKSACDAADKYRPDQASPFWGLA